MLDLIPNPEDEPAGTALASVGPPPKAAVVVPRSAGMQTLDELIRYSQIFAKAGMFKGLTAGDMQRQAAMCAVKVIAGHELGLSPMASMRSIHVFDGQVSLSGSLIIAKINQHPLYKARIRVRTNELCTIAFFTRETPTSEWEHLEDVTWTLDDARRAGLLKKDNWVNYPRPLLFNRAASEGARVHCPDVFMGPIYTPEELQPDAPVDAQGQITYDQAMDDATTSVEEFDDEIRALATRAGWTDTMLKAQMVRFGDRARLLDLLTKTVDRTENGSRGKARAKAEAKPEAHNKGLMTPETRATLFGALGRHGVTDREDRIAWAQRIGVDIGNPPSFRNLAEASAQKLLDALVVASETGGGLLDRVWPNMTCAACGNDKVHKFNCPIDEEILLDGQD